VIVLCLSPPRETGLARVASERTASARNSRDVDQWISVLVVADPRDENGGSDRAARPARPVGDLADEVERAQTPRTPVRALSGVWLTVALTVALVLAVVAVTIYFVAD
jgi:hypothetical protein